MGSDRWSDRWSGRWDAGAPRPDAIRRERGAARDAALRRVTVWTVALALGSAGGTAAVYAVTGAPAHASTAVPGDGQAPPTPGAGDPGAVGADPGPAVAGQDGGGVAAPPPVVSSGS